MQTNKESLQNILQYAASDTYRSLMILTETLPNMVDMDRKAAIVDYVRESRSLFFRIIAILKWAQTSPIYEDIEEMLSKVRGPLEAIVDTANHLYHIARIQLPTCTIPLACVLPAADVLSSGTYNRLPSCYFDTRVDTTSIDFPAVRARVAKQLIRILATRNFDNFKYIQYKGDHLVLSTCHADIRLTTLNAYKGPWKIFDIKLRIFDKLESNKCIATKAQIQYLINFIQNSMNKSLDPLDRMLDILVNFCYKTIFEIFRLQLWKHHKISGVKFESQKEKLIIKYWENVTRRGFITLTVTLKNTGILVEHDPPLDSLNINIDNLNEIDSIKIIQDVIKARINQFFVNIYQHLTVNSNISVDLVSFIDGTIIYRPSHSISATYEIQFCLNEISGELLIKGGYFDRFIKIRGDFINTRSSLTEWVDFLIHYRRFSIIDAVKFSSAGHQPRAMKIVPTNRKNDFPSAKAIVNLYRAYGNLCSVFISTTSVVSLVVLATDLGKDSALDYRIFMINPLGQKIDKDCVADIHIKTILSISEIYDIRYIHDIPLFKFLDICDLDLSYCIRNIIEKAELTTLVSSLQYLGYNSSTQFLVTQPVFRQLTLLDFFMSNFENISTKDLLHRFMNDIFLAYDSLNRVWYVEFDFSNKLVEKYKKFQAPLVVRIFISIYEIYPFDRIFFAWKNFMFLFDNSMRIVYNSAIYSKISSISLLFKQITVTYSDNKYGLTIKIKNNQPHFKFFSRLGHSSPFSDQVCQSYLNRYATMRNIPKTLYMLFSIEKLVLLFNGLKQSVRLTCECTVSNVQSHLVCFQMSLMSFCITYKNCYSLNFTLIDEDYVQVSDNSYSTLWKDKRSNTNSLIPITFLAGFLAFECENLGLICKKYPPSAYTIHRSVIDRILSFNQTRVVNNNIPGFKTCRLLLFLETSYFLRSVATIFKLTQFSLVEDSCIAFDVPPFVFVINYSFEETEIPLFLSFKIYEKVAGASTLATILQQYLYERILVTEFQSVNLLQFFSIFSLDQGFIENFSQILRIELHPRDDLNWYIRWRHLPNGNLPLKNLPISTYLIYQNEKYLIMIDFVLKSDPAVYITGIFVWLEKSNRLQDFYLYESLKLTEKSEEVQDIHAQISDQIKDLILESEETNILLSQLVLITLRCIIENEIVLEL